MSDTGLDTNLDEALQLLMNRLRPSEMRSAWRKLALHLRAQNRQRIRANQNPDGSPYEPRKDRTNRKKMLTGFSSAKYLKYKMRADHVAIGIMGAGPAAAVHHLGKTEGGIRYPSRALIGLSDDDKKAALEILNVEVIAAHLNPRRR